MITAAEKGQSMNLYYAESVDGIHWSFRRPIDEKEDDKVYPTIIGLGNDPHITDSEFYVYYVQTPKWQSADRWTNAFLARRKINCAP